MEKINIAKLLKGCPKGMELDCTMYDSVQLDAVIEEHTYPIKIQTPDGIKSLSKDGCYSLNPHCKCIIFPKGKTTWEGFQRPFKDGDVIYIQSLYEYIVIYKKTNCKNLYKHAAICISLNNRFLPDNNILCCEEDVKKIRFATEEEKQKLFDVIKANGYKWAPETKTLEKLIKPKFKVGDRVKKNKDYISGIVTDIFDDSFKVTYDSGGCSYVQFHYQCDWELVPNKFDITTLEPFESRVLIRDDGYRLWQPGVWGLYDKEHRFPYITIGNRYKQCIPYDGNEHLLGTTNDCDDYYKTWE